ncbi:hypothetical protein HPB50_022357 [Hyalomma asiaticum]|uniref:Uncharacterized protein n=1 Tax=Hyalomma asiaticum TaxID=266040 RepID=A0ACB7S2Y7_HYAAI|nr:hypothetical protein HPB50_022357 [Hyalomma asiaticum]
MGKKEKGTTTAFGGLLVVRCAREPTASVFLPRRGKKARQPSANERTGEKRAAAAATAAAAAATRGAGWRALAGPGNAHTFLPSKPASRRRARARLATAKERERLLPPPSTESLPCLPGLAGAAASTSRRRNADREQLGVPHQHGRRTCSLPGKETAVKQRRPRPTTTKRHVRDGATSGRTGLRRHVAPSPQLSWSFHPAVFMSCLEYRRVLPFSVLSGIGGVRPSSPTAFARSRPYGDGLVRRGQLELSGGGSEDEHGGGARSPAAGGGPVRGAAGTPPAPQQSPLRPTPSPGAAPPGPGGGGPQPPGSAARSMSPAIDC